MTTIVYRSGTLAADSQTQTDNLKSPYDLKKVYKLESGALVAGAGVRAEIEGAIRAIEAEENFEITEGILIFVTKGNVRVYEAKGYFDLGEIEFDAWGSGRMAALGALFMGASAKQAVEIAIKCDADSGGKVHSESLRKWWE